MKKCDTCKQDKEITEFNKNKAKKDGYNSICRSCSNIRSKKYYYDNRETHLANVYARRKLTVKVIYEKIDEIKRLSGCVYCDENEPCCLDFHHPDPNNKTGEVATLARTHVWNRVKAEIEKCLVVCSNCHRKIHKGIKLVPKSDTLSRLAKLL